uniref:Putative conserved plasma membrane protein n=1 Tax=Corethrella appendiculata TaxID=1370023 RepID=U5ES36_9DIPT
MAVGRVAGNMGGGYSGNYYSGRSYHGSSINEEIIWVSIGMAIVIGILITLALLYIIYEKCQKRREYYINA